MANFPSTIANLVAIQKGLRFGIECGLTPDVIEVNEAEVVKWINNGLHYDSEVGLILMDIKTLTDSQKKMMFRQIATSANKSAFGLAKFSLNNLEDSFLDEEFPYCVSRCIQADMPG
ncbi:hypothetical protein Ddye_000526 [Dipteronia dyeriana]|uniref:RNase H type-1 domain-containing protein n=1 Tax=Dipteronia dyeriana TaxID=168575 RepID=A0AAD9XMK8_9ROSI|nr:hypothetical protein Ddye_000526 [Dipteronia dyeriana]